MSERKLTRQPATGHVGAYWTTISLGAPGATPEIRFWTGYSWLEFGSEKHLQPDIVATVSQELEYE